MDEERFKLISKLDDAQGIYDVVSSISREVAQTSRLLKNDPINLSARNLDDNYNQENSYNTEYVVGDVVRDIETESNLVIKGNILPGCTVRCSSSLTVMGKINAANIYCKGNLTALNGIDSSKENTIDVRGRIKSKFVKNASIECYKGVTITEDAVDSDIISRKNIDVGGKVVGGNLSAVSGVQAENIESSGSLNGTTNIRVGIHYKLVQLLDDMSSEIAEITQKCGMLRNIIKKYELKDSVSAEKLTYTERKHLTELKNSLRNLFYIQVSGLKSRFDSLKRRIEKNRKATISVAKSVAAGTSLTLQDKTIVTPTQMFGINLCHDRCML
ncbi:MAG: DUF342 domain-containing protein [Fibrobacteres bacterium]|nr:DUF342 domain-containing protein [Fibrobacterota bacterium]